MVAGARAMMRYRRTSRGSEGAMQSSSPIATPKVIFQNPSKQPINTISATTGTTTIARKSSPVASDILPWPTTGTSAERTSKTASSSRGILKAGGESWIPTATSNATQEDASALNIGKQFVTKVKAKASNIFYSR
jgi:hypothetical protein